MSKMPTVKSSAVEPEILTLCNFTFEDYNKARQVRSLCYSSLVVLRL
jgi:hypothetical protein